MTPFELNLSVVVDDDGDDAAAAVDGGLAMTLGSVAVVVENLGAFGQTLRLQEQREEFRLGSLISRGTITIRGDRPPLDIHRITYGRRLEWLAEQEESRGRGDLLEFIFIH